MTDEIPVMFSVGKLLFEDRRTAEQYAKETAPAGKDAAPVIAMRAVRPSDLLIFVNIVGDMRERLAELAGDDSVMDDGSLRDALVDGSLERELAAAFDTAMTKIGVDVTSLGYTKA